METPFHSVAKSSPGAGAGEGDLSGSPSPRGLALREHFELRLRGQKRRAAWDVLLKGRRAGRTAGQTKGTTARPGHWQGRTEEGRQTETQAGGQTGRKRREAEGERSGILTRMDVKERGPRAGGDGARPGLGEETGLDPEGKAGEGRGGGERDRTSHPTAPPSRGEEARLTPQVSLCPVHLQTATQRQPAN